MPYYKKHMENKIKQVITELRNKRYREIGILGMEAWITDEPVDYEQRTSGEYIIPEIGKKWAEKLWSCAWFNLTGYVPASSAGKEIVLKIDISGEACVFDSNGVPVKGLTTRCVFENKNDFNQSQKRIYQITDRASGGEKIDIWLDAGNNDLFGNDLGSLVREASICELNRDIRGLYYDMIVLLDLAECIEFNSARCQRILFRLYEAACMLDKYGADEIETARALLKKELDRKNGDSSLTITAIGHAHIDLAWLWPIRETKRKIARTFSTALDLMDRYPNYRFGESQPQQYEWLKKLHPKLYGEVKQRVAENRWEVQGGMWCEADTNISGGEALVRQLLYGLRFFKEEFGKEVNNLWLPDVFGYSAALPQILKKSGISYFMTQKLSWNEHNKFPHHTFNWEGIDGSVVLAHMLPEETYNSPATPSAVRKAEMNYSDSGVCEESLMLFGTGDGGGGPSAGHLEFLDRIADLNGIVPVKQGFACDFFDRIAKNKDKYVTYKGELYLEKHQGTLTTSARNKKYNRLMEINLHELEFAAVLCSRFSDIPFPKEEIDEIWKEVLLYQFHDILPGSSINRVYDESTARYKILYDRVREITDGFYKEAMNKINAPVNSYIVFNSASFERSEWLRVDGNDIYVRVPEMGYAVVNCGDLKEERTLYASESVLENSKIRVEFNTDGTVTQIINKSFNRGLLKTGTRSNVLNLYEDKGDAWDIPITYRDKKPAEFKLVGQKAYTDGVFAVLEQDYSYGKSTLTQKVTLTADGERLDFKTRVDWHEESLMLRTSFETDVYADFVTCNIQFGKIKRSVLNNTAQDMAMFEISAHNFIDISQSGFGVSLMNDCKYGYYAKKNVLDLNLLRAQSSPSYMVDHGMHEFTYSVYAHIGNETEAGVTREAYSLNHPLRVYKADKTNGGATDSFSYIKIDKSNVIIETLKPAEDGNGVIARLYESEGIACKTVLTLPEGTEKVSLVSLTEKEIFPLTVKNNVIELNFGIFEITTIKINMRE